MSSFFRSDIVNQYKLILPRQSAWDIMNKLGQSKLVHVVPSLNSILSKPFFLQVKRCEQGLQKIESLEKILYDKSITEIETNYEEQAFQELYAVWEEESTRNEKNPISMLDSFEQSVNGLWNYYFDLNKRVEELTHKLNFYRQNLAIIRGGEKQYGRAFFTNSQNRIDQLGQLFMKEVTRVSFKTGVIEAADQIRFKRTVFRITKGNCIISCLHFTDIFENVQQVEMNKMVFFILFPAQEDNYLDKKITKLVQSYCDEMYDLPSKPEEFESKIRTLQDSYTETEKLLSLTKGQMDQFLNKLAATSQQCRVFRKFEYLKLYLLKQKQLYTQLNQMELYNNFLKGQIYVRKDDVPDLQRLLLNIQKTMKIPSGQIVAVDTNKFPTKFVCNTYTQSAQEIVETYGVARYQEANPSLFTTVTFPFLFGVMFGDMAHGAILLTFGAYLCLYAQSLNKGMLKLILPHRYLLTMMGFFAVYCGLIYNDCMSISLNLFGSCYNIAEGQKATDGKIPRYSEDCVYGLGIDPVWAVAENNLNYVNSLKMKISVIIAVIHMTVGVFVKLSNSLYFRRWVELIFQSVPQLIFMVVLFGYMDFLIVFKWLQPWTEQSAEFAPSIITTMINLPLKLGKTQECCGGQPLWGTFGDTSQDKIQLILLIVAVVCIPVMLLVKPLYEIYCKDHSSRAVTSSNRLMQSSQALQDDKKEVHDDGQEHEASEIFVHQMIETIEYILGCISNTASYLRLWALSLAHSQLSEVFLDKTVQAGIVKGYGGLPIMVVGFLVLAAATFGVLLCMDSMECFLHTLRLHWVEFQNKFYKGDGFPFVCFDFTARIQSSFAKPI